MPESVPKSPETADQSRLKGVFSTCISSKVGTGATTRKVEQTVYYYAEEHEDGWVSIQPLTPSWTPTLPKKRIEKQRFYKGFTPEPEIYTQKTIPALQKMAKHVAKAEGYRKRGEAYSAEFEYKNALKLDENNIRALFGLGLSYLERGERDQGDDVFKKVVTLEEAFGHENKHLFNEFGIKLRKNKMYDQALAYYGRAFKKNRTDENLLYNIARTFIDKGDLKKAGVCLKQALQLRKDFNEARELLAKVVAKLKRDKAKQAAQAKT